MKRALLTAVLCTWCVYFPFAGTTVAQPPGTIETFAGGGPNNMPALDANLSTPTGAVMDDEGNLYISVGGIEIGHHVFKVDTAGQLTVVAGVGIQGFSDDTPALANTVLLGRPYAMP